MPAVHKLLLEEALQDSPQNEMALAMEQLSKQLLAYEQQNFALSQGDAELIGTLQSFAKAMEEHEASMVKYSRLPKKKENEKVEVVKEVAYSRRKQHQASMQYYCALNALQHRKRVAMLEPLLGYTRAQMSFFKKGVDLVSKKMDSFLTSSASMAQSIQAQLDCEAEEMRLSQRELLSVEDTVYTPDHDQDPINRTLVQKAGYLNIRNKTGLVSTAWDRLYFFTQGGNLMCQPRGAVAGGMILDLDNSSVMAVECEDRRYCFQITASMGKTSITLQAESKKEYEEWISTINNISRQIYLTENPEAVAIRLNQTAMEAVTPVTSFEKRLEGLPDPSRADPGAVPLPAEPPQKPPRTRDSEDLIAPGTPIQFDIMLPASEFQDQNRAGGRRTNPFGESEEECSADNDDALLQQVFDVRFLGSMAVRSGRGAEVIYEAARQVLAARAIHNIFRTTEAHLMVTSSCLRLIDPQTQVTRISFQLQDVTHFAAHQENGRLMGFMVEGRDWGQEEDEGQPSFSAYIFESNTEGEKDPATLAELMKSMPLTSDGKFLLLETEDEQSKGQQEELESEA
ncbi:hypothetical protein JZ751_013013 [Albula glossodonta]|uniref:DCC-interacting protein 13-beta n=1 Tax=Albula glossodonta TaxID=121402 RepID=A0A8T2MT44_9TELE|nr:hypothetical protein JZ751_013013 [Albula glossodonta]